MPKQRMALRMIKDVIRLKWEAQLPHESIAAAVGISKGAVAKYVGLASAAGLDWETVRDWDERQLISRLLPNAAAVSPYVEPDWARVHRELDRKGVTLMLLWQEYVEAHPAQRTWRYTQFCEHYKAFTRGLKRSMRQHRRAGEKLFIDFAGPTVALRGGARAQVFVSAMGASSYTFACATPAQKLADWIEAMVRALCFYGGVPQLIVPDNARAVIANPDRYEPRANETVLDFARHYSTSVLAARPHSPKDKASAESAVQVVTRWILARLRHRSFETVAEVDAAIAQLLPSLNERPFQKLPGSRASVFAELDAPALMPLPASRYELARFKTVKVHIDYHVEIDAHRYSVPHALVSQSLEARLTARGVELLLRGNRVASHARSDRRGGFTTLDEHMPAAHRAHRDWTPQRLIDWGSRIGVATGEVVTRLLHQNKHPEHGYRACLGLLGLAKRYGTARLEAACERVLALGAFKYRHVRDVLANNRDRVAPAGHDGEWTSPAHANVRGPGHYQ
ncbi:MAG: IS21 family transposase [Burkholderiaceae bacterium]|nr:IS21 family transposase [Burkholderiaceae bacterium]